MAGLTPEGWLPKTYAEVLADIEQRERADIEEALGEALDLSEFSLLGQLNRIVANDIAELWEVGTALYDMLDPDKVTGAQQDSLYAITNTPREAATRSTVTATVNLDPGVSIAVEDAVASVTGNPTARFHNVAPMVNAGGATADFEVPFEAEATGPVAAPSGQLVVIETFITGWNSITNAEAGELGTDTESDALYRQRRVEELAAPGGATLIGIRAELLRVEDVTAVQVLENVTDEVDANGLPPHSIEAIVQGGADQDIVDTLWENRAAGIQAFGSEGPFVVLDPDGNEHSIAFSRPTLRPVFMAFELETDELYVGDDQFKAVIETAAISLDNQAYLEGGAEVYSARFVIAAMTVPGVINAIVGLAFTAITDPEDGAQRLDIGPRELATVAAANIDIGVLS